jgi:hypothetical protein
MVYRKPWSFRIGVVVFGALAFLAATGRSIGGEAGAGTPPATITPPPVQLLLDVAP